MDPVLITQEEFFALSDEERNQLLYDEMKNLNKLITELFELFLKYIETKNTINEKGLKK
jgi:hypothetical protein